MHLEGIPSDLLPDVLATGAVDTRFAFISLSAREPSGRDAEYIEWHSLDHRPEQYRLAGLRNALRLVSTPACRAARVASEGEFAAVDHVMTYLFTSGDAIPAFRALGDALDRAGRMPLRLPSIGYMTATLAGKAAAASAVAGADVIPWRPARGVYLIVEEGHTSPEALIDVPGVAGIWWLDGAVAPAPYTNDARERRITYCFLDGDPIETGKLIGAQLQRRWASGDIKGLLGAPFFVIVPFEWARYLPTPG